MASDGSCSSQGGGDTPRSPAAGVAAAGAASAAFGGRPEQNMAAAAWLEQLAATAEACASQTGGQGERRRLCDLVIGAAASSRAAARHLLRQLPLSQRMAAALALAQRHAAAERLGWSTKRVAAALAAAGRELDLLQLGVVVAMLHARCAQWAVVACCGRQPQQHRVVCRMADCTQARMPTLLIAAAWLGTLCAALTWHSGPGLPRRSPLPGFQAAALALLGSHATALQALLVHWLLQPQVRCRLRTLLLLYWGGCMPCLEMLPAAHCHGAPRAHMP